MIGRLVLLVGIVGTGLLALVLEERAVRRQHEQAVREQELRALRELAATADNRALSAHLSDVELTYDPLVDALNELRRRSRQLADVDDLAAFRTRLAATEDRVEDLKRHRAHRHNSERYVERFLTQVAPEDPAVVAVERELARYLTEPSPERELALRRATEGLGPAVWPELPTLQKHVGILAESRRSLDNLARELLAADLGTPAAAAVDTWVRAAREEAAQRQRWRVALLAVIAVLALAETARQARRDLA